MAIVVFQMRSRRYVTWELQYPRPVQWQQWVMARRHCPGLGLRGLEAGTMVPTVENGSAASCWATADVLSRLYAATRPGCRAQLHIFLSDQVASDEIEHAARRITAEAVAATGTTGAELGPIRRTARSFLVSAEMPALAVIAARPEVSAILPTEVTDIFPKPARRGKARS